jgi:hypothetical protein
VSPIALRYQVFPIAILFVFSVLAIRFIDPKEQATAYITNNPEM